MSEYIPPPQANAVSHSGTTYGDLGTRFVARLIDGIILAVAVYGVLASILYALFRPAGGGLGVGLGYGNAIGYAFLFAVLSTAIQLGYYVAFETTQGQTLGKMIMKLDVRGPAGGLPTVEQSLRRNFFYAFGLASFIPIIGFLASLASLAAVIWVAVSISSSPTGQGVHDQFAGGTMVLKGAAAAA